MIEVKRFMTLLCITSLLAAAACGDSETLRTELAGKWVRTVLAEGGACKGTLTFTAGDAFEFSLNCGVKGYGRPRSAARRCRPTSTR